MNALLPQIPEGFDAFWRETAEEAVGAPLDFNRRKGQAYDLPGFAVELFSFRGFAGAPRHGWIASPEIRSAEGRAFLWIPPYGRESLLPSTFGIREGFVSASFNFFGYAALHQEKYVRERGYFAQGALSPNTWIFREMFCDAVLAARFLAAQPEVDPDRVAAAGMSQGGGMSIWLGAWVPIVKCVCADMPFLGGMSQVLGGHVYRYPTKELTDFAQTVPNGLEKVKRTIAFFDTLNQAARCARPTQLALGEKDPSVRPPAVESIFAALPGRKRLRRYPIGHDWFPDMIPNNRDWMMENL